MAEQKVSDGCGKATHTERTWEAKGKMTQGCAILYDVLAAFETLAEGLARAEEFGTETIIRSLSKEIGLGIEELEEAEILFRPKSDCIPSPDTTEVRSSDPVGDIMGARDSLRLLARALEEQHEYGQCNLLWLIANQLDGVSEALDEQNWQPEHTLRAV